MSREFIVRLADPGDAEALTRLAEAVSAEPEAWLISADGEWRSVGDERRYLKAVRRYPHAAVFAAERLDGAIVGRLSLARDTQIQVLGLIARVNDHGPCGRCLGSHDVAVLLHWADGEGPNVEAAHRGAALPPPPCRALLRWRRL